MSNLMMTNYKFLPDTRVTVLTGAGISAESGLKTFRDNNGLWEKHRVEDVATPAAFIKDPAMVWKFYKLRYRQLQDVTPNPGHYALKKMEDFLGDNMNIITQNIDGLHGSAGSKNVTEMHGSLNSCYCTACHVSYEMKSVDLIPRVPICKDCGGSLRPDIVWFGEVPYHLERIGEILNQTEYFIVAGTSGVVYPAAYFLFLTRIKGAVTIGINLEKPANLDYINEFHQGRTGEILPRLVEIWTGN